MDFIYKRKWFSNSTPLNPKAATGTLSFTGIPVVTETVTIGTEVYEICTATATGTNIPVVIGATVTADKAVTELAAAITFNSKIATAIANVTDDTVVVTYKTVGTAGNDIASTQTCTNATWGEDKLAGGQFGTPCPEAGSLLKDETYYYVCTIAGNHDDVQWERFQTTRY